MSSLTLPDVSRHLQVPQPPARQLFGKSIPLRRAAWSTVSPAFTGIDWPLICAERDRRVACIDENVRRRPVGGEVPR